MAKLDPNMPINGATLNNYLVQIKKAAGGQIIPYLNMDYCVNPHGRYRCTDGTTGPTCFWEVSSALLSLTAIANGSHTVMLESWETFNRCGANPLYCSLATIKSVLQEIKSNGWDGGIIANDIGPFFSDQEEASYVNVGVSFPDASPWMTPDPAVLTQALGETYISGVFVSIDTQAQVCPKQGAMDQILANLNADQKALSLTELAQNQASGHYIFVYPLEMFADNPATQSCDNSNGDPGYWDATRFLQSNNQPFLNLIIGLTQQYNRTGRQRFPPLR